MSIIYIGLLLDGGIGAVRLLRLHAQIIYESESMLQEDAPLAVTKRVADTFPTPVKAEVIPSCRNPLPS